MARSLRALSKPLLCSFESGARTVTSGGAFQENRCLGGRPTPGSSSVLTGSVPHPQHCPAPLAAVTAVTGLSVPGAWGTQDTSEGRCGCFSMRPWLGSDAGARAWGPRSLGAALWSSAPLSLAPPLVPQRPCSHTHLLARQPAQCQKGNGHGVTKPSGSGTRNWGHSAQCCPCQQSESVP